MGLNRILSGLVGATNAGGSDLPVPQTSANVADPAAGGDATSRRGDQQLYADYQRHKVESLWEAQQKPTSESSREEESPLSKALREIGPVTINERDVPHQILSVELPKSAAEMSQEDYEIAYLRTMFRASGLGDVTTSEILTFQHDLKEATGAQFALHATLDNLRAAQGDTKTLQVATSKWSIAVVSAGKRDIYRQRQEQAAHIDELRRASQVYGEEALAGFYKVQGNGAINLLNDATKLVGAPEIPKFEVRGEYWQDKKGVAETATTITAGVMTGGAGLAGDLLVISSSAGNMTEAVAGTDLRTGEELSTAERVIRSSAGLIGAYSVRGRIDQITESVETQACNIARNLPSALNAEAVSAEGVTVRLSAQAATDEATRTATQMESRVAKEVESATPRQNIQTHESAGGHTIEKHVGKSEAKLRERLAKDVDLVDASSFYNEAIANRAQMNFVAQHKQEIAEWLKSGSYKFTGEIEMSQAVGKVIGRGKHSAPVETNKAFFVLLRNNSPLGWYVRTSFPLR